MDRNRERILCAAVHFDDGRARVHQPRNIATGIVICGRRHHNCFATAAEQGWCDPTQYWRDSGGKRPPAVQGFLTSADRFVNRAEAASIARSTQVAWTRGRPPQGLSLRTLRLLGTGLRR
jgi:hypothetical protein